MTALQEWVDKYPGDPEALRDALVQEIERLQGLIQELFDFTTPTNDAAKFEALTSVMAESGWWKRAKDALGTNGRAGSTADWDDEGYVRQHLAAALAKIEAMTIRTSEGGLDTLALRAAELIEDEFARGHVGGRTQRLAKIQVIVREAIREPMTGERAWDAWRPGTNFNTPSKPIVTTG